MTKTVSIADFPADFLPLATQSDFYANHDLHTFIHTSKKVNVMIMTNRYVEYKQL